MSPALFIRRPVLTTLLMAAVLSSASWPTGKLPVNDLPNVDFPTIQVSASLPGASPETMASAVATPLERQFTTIAGIDSMTSTSALGASPDHHPVHPRSQHRRRRPGRAGGHHQGRAAAAAGHADAAQLSEGESGRPAGALPRPQLAHPAAVHGGRVCPDQPRPADLDHQRRGPGARLRLAEVRGARAGRPARPGHAGHRDRRGGHRGRPRQRQPADRHAVRAAPGDQRAVHRPAHRRGGLSADGRRLPQRLAGAAGGSRPGHRRRADRQGRQLVQQRPRGGAGRPAAARHEHDRGRGRRAQAAAHLPPAAAGGGQPGRRLRPLGRHPRVGPRRAVHAAAHHRPGRAGHLRLPAQRLGHAHPEPGGAAVDRRHLRGDVPARLHDRHHLADGAHPVRGLRGGRRDRHAGEHRPPHGIGHGPHGGGAQGRAARSASRSCR